MRVLHGEPKPGAEDVCWKSSPLRRSPIKHIRVASCKRSAHHTHCRYLFVCHAGLANLELPQSADIAWGDSWCWGAVVGQLVGATFATAVSDGSANRLVLPKCGYCMESPNLVPRMSVGKARRYGVRQLNTSVLLRVKEVHTTPIAITFVHSPVLVSFFWFALFNY